MIHYLRSKNQPPSFADASEIYITSVTAEIESLRIYPRLNSYRDLVLLALLDRIVTTSRAVVSLVRAGFANQAFGLSRTSIEAFFALKYIENTDSETRAKRYLEYFGKDREHLMAIVSKHHPHLASARSPDYDKLMKMAKKFKSPHKWYPEASLKEVAYEKSTWALDEHGKPEHWEYTYDVVYKLTSHEVHSTSVAIESRVADFLENSRYPEAFGISGPTKEFEGNNALVNACIHAQAAIEHVFHAFEIDVRAIRKKFEDWQTVTGLGPQPTSAVAS